MTDEYGYDETRQEWLRTVWPQGYMVAPDAEETEPPEEAAASAPQAEQTSEPAGQSGFQKPVSKWTTMRFKELELPLANR